MTGVTERVTDLDAVRRYLLAIRDRDDMVFTSTPFDRLYGAAVIAGNSEDAPPFPTAHLRNAHNHYGEVKTIILKVAWLADQRDNGGLDAITWLYFCGSDVLAFHVVMKLLLDEVGSMARRLAVRPDVVPDASFGDIVKWIDRRPQNVERLGAPLADAIRSCWWFDELRSVREDLVHRSAETIAFPENGRILFQVHVGDSRRILIPEVMFNDNVADFAAYAALTMARLAAFLDVVAEAAFATVSELDPSRDGEVKSGHPGLRILRTWLTALKTRIESHQD
jgi:hypothetical protein